MLVSEIEWRFAKQNKKSFTPKLCMWKLKDQDVVCRFQDELNNLIESDANLILQSNITIKDLSISDPVLGPPLLITKEMVVKSICKMKNGKASGPLGVVTKMLKASSSISCELIADHTNSIV